MKRRYTLILLFFLAGSLLYSSVTQIELSTQVQELLQVANGGTAVATTGARNVFSGPLAPGTTGPPSFKSASLLWPYSPLPDSARILGFMHCDRPAFDFCSEWGDEYESLSGGAGGYAAASGTERAYFYQATTAAANNSSYIDLFRLTIRAGKNAVVGGTFKYVNSTDARRCWIAFSNITNLNALSDTPWTGGGSISWVGMRFSTTAPDSFWTTFVADDTSGVLATEVTSVAQDSNWHTFQIYVDDTNSKTYFLMDGVAISTLNAVYSMTGVAVGLHIAGFAVNNLNSGVSQEIRTTGLYKTADQW